jgi:helix-turn-helix protein
VKGARGPAALPTGGPAIDPHRLEPLFAQRIAELALRVEAGDVDCWRPLCEALTAYQALKIIGSPDRAGRQLTTGEMAQRLGVRPKSLRRMVAEGRIQPTVKAGRFTRWSGRERPGGGGAGR